MHRIRSGHVCLTFFVAAMAGMGAFAADALTQLGIPAAAAREEAVSAVSQGYFNWALAAKGMKAAPPSARGELVAGVMAWAKAYTASPEFKASYAKVRAQQKPTPPEFTGTPEDEFNRQRAEQKAEQEKSQAEVKATLPSLPPETRKAIEEGLKQAAATMAAMDTPEMRKMQIDGITMARADKKRQYDESLKKWQADYPEDAKPLVAKRLRHFLDETKDVDFGAALVTRNGTRTFAKPEYESKSGEWKQAFRAGKEAVTAARTAAEAWLAELQK